jgi:peptidoglycan/LPS O-acetylase OafA/YrhL
MGRVISPLPYEASDADKRRSVQYGVGRWVQAVPERTAVGDVMRAVTKTDYETPEVVPSVPYRGDIDGLRALAILLVVAFHAEVPGLAGGFVGVDVFFVISGWLITSQLLIPIENRRPPALMDFWARRVRRLIPASGLMIAATMAASLVILSPLEWDLIERRGLAAALYISNLLFAYSGGDYFGGPLQESPFLHTWSLAVEEQFYLLWPLLFVAVGRRAMRRPATDSRRTLGLAMGAIGLSSLGLSVVLVDRQPLWAFYGLPTRAWQFAAAGLLVMTVHRRRAIPPRFTSVLASFGLVLIAVAAVSYDEDTAFPGVPALLPVAGTLLLLLAGHRARSTDSPILQFLGSSPLRQLGQLSYSWYLWHWPFMVLAVALFVQDSVGLRLSAAVASLAVAAAAHHLVENPLRFSDRLKRSQVRTYSFGFAITVGCVLLALGMEAYRRHQVNQPPHQQYEIARQSFRDAECDLQTSPKGHSYCLGGDRTALRTIMLVGDSHANQWMSAFGEAGERVGVRVLLRHQGNCTATPLDRSSGELPLARRSCADFQGRTNELLEELQPDAIVLADALTSRNNAFDDEPTRWSRALTSHAEDIRGRGFAVGLVVDNVPGGDPLRCLSRSRSAAACEPDVGELEDFNAYRKEGVRVGQTIGLPQLDVTSLMCDDRSCAIFVDEVPIHAASNHLTKAFTKSQVPQVIGLMKDLLSSELSQ